MLVKYNGEYARESRSYGCSKCGTGRSISGVETYRTVYTTYYNGRLYIFEKGKIYPVEGILGKYLTNLTYTDKEGNIRHAFSEVEENLESEYVVNIEDKEIPVVTEEPKPETPVVTPVEEPTYPEGPTQPSTTEEN